MDQSVFNSIFQSSLYNLVFNLARKTFTNEAAAPSAAPPALTDQTSAGATRSTSQAAPSPFDDLIRQASERYGVPQELVQAVVRAESNYQPNAVSSAGALGLMQLMPATARGLGVTNPLDPTQNIDGGTRLLQQLLNRYDGNVRLALAAYNAGPGAVERFGGIPPYAETQTYVTRVMNYYQSETSWKA